MIDSEKINLFKKQGSKNSTSDFSQNYSSLKPSATPDRTPLNKTVNAQPDEINDYSRKNMMARSNTSSFKSATNECCESFYRTKTSSMSLNDGQKNEEDSMNSVEKEIL